METLKVLITDYVHPVLEQELTKMGYLIDYRSQISLCEVKEIIHNYNGVIVNSKTVMDRSMIDLGKRLEFIGRLGSGLEIIDLDYAKEKGIQVFNSPEGNRNAVAEHALGMLLALANNLLTADQEVRNFNWNREKNRGFELEGKKIGIIGFGHTGSSFAKLLKGFDVDILAYDKYKKNYSEGFSNVTISSLEEIKSKADIISLHLPLTDETYHLVNEEFINDCKNGVILINTSRGKVVKLDALIQGLVSKKIGGVCLDVFENEKPATFDSEEKSNYTALYALDNAILTPHVAGWTDESLLKIAQCLIYKIKKNVLRKC